MEEQAIYDVLTYIIKKIENRSIIWRLEGSANLRIQGIPLPVKDLDITTDKDGIKTFEEILGSEIQKLYYNQRTQSSSLIASILGEAVEINNYNQKGLNMLDRMKPITWKGLEFPILPLPAAREFYHRIKRNEKVQIIDNYLRKRKSWK